MSATFKQPDQTVDTAPEYKASIDASIAVLAEIANNFSPHEASPLSMGITLNSGKLWNGIAHLSKAAANTVLLTAPASQPRIDRFAIDINDGSIVLISGTEAPSPVAPDYGPNNYPICQVVLAVSQTTIVNADITDERPLIDTMPTAFNNASATTNPTVNDDVTLGYSVNSVWINVTLDEAYRCLDTSTGAAVWVNTTMDAADVAAIYAPLISPALTGTPSAPTATVNDNTTKLATTEFVQTALISSNKTYVGYGISTTNLTVSVNSTLDSGEYHYDNLTVNAGITLKPTETVNGTLIIRGNTLTLNGEISADGYGAAAGLDYGGANHTGVAGAAGYLGGGGGGGGWADFYGGPGGAANYNAGGAALGIGPSGNGGSIQANASDIAMAQMAMSLVYGSGLYDSTVGGGFRVKGGGGGGSGGDTNGNPGDGGRGGGIIILIFKNIVFGAAAIVSAKGLNGTLGTSDGAGGGGGGGAAIIITENLTDGGVTNTATGGTGGAGNTGDGGDGGDGYAGIMQI